MAPSWALHSGATCLPGVAWFPNPMSEHAREHLATDADLGPVVERVGPVSLDPAEDPFERLVVALVRQQVSTEAAAAIRERLFERVEVTPAGLLAADTDVLRDAGLSAAKTEYVRAAAAAFRDREYDRSTFADMNDETVVAELTDIRGIGPWTAKMFLLFCLGREDVFPVEDLAIRKGMWEVVDEGLTRAEMRERAGDWAPYRSYASLYLWRAVE